MSAEFSVWYSNMYIGVKYSYMNSGYRCDSNKLNTNKYLFQATAVYGKRRGS